MRRLVVLATTVALATCQPGDEVELGTLSGDAATGLLVVDLDPVVAAAGDASAIRLRVNDQTVAELTLPAGGDALEGHPAWTVKAGTEVAIGLELVNGKVAWPGPDKRVVVTAGEAVKMSAQLDGRGRPALTEPSHILLEASDGATVDYATGERAQAWLPRLGDRPVAALASILADPQIAVLTPTATNGSEAGAIGPLVAWRSDNATISEAAATSEATSEDQGAAQGHAATLLGQPMDRPVQAYLRYYSHCSCGRAAVGKAFQLNTADGRRLEGQTDRFGMVMVPGVAQAGVNFGPSQHERKRKYAFIAGEPETRDAILNALEAADPNDVLTALLDLQAQPLPAARPRLLELLQHDNPVVWRNAAVTLSRYPDGALAGLEALGPPPQGEAGLLRHLTIHGALRHPEAVNWLSRQLSEGSPAARAVSAWGIGFIGHARGLTVLERAASDSDPAVRAEVALALGRVGSTSALETLETLMGDAEASVASRAAEAVRLLQM